MIWNSARADCELHPIEIMYEIVCCSALIPSTFRIKRNRWSGRRDSHPHSPRHRRRC